MNDGIGPENPARDLICALTTTRAELAEQIGVSTGTLYSWATGRRQPGRDNARRLIDVARRRAQFIGRHASELGRVSALGEDEAAVEKLLD